MGGEKKKKKRLVDGSSQTALEALEFRQQKMDWRHLQTRSPWPRPSLWEQLYQQQPLTHLLNWRGRSPLNLNIRSLWFAALGCPAPGAHLKGKRGSRVPGAHRRITPRGKLVSAAFPLNLNALEQTVAPERHSRCVGKIKR